MVKKVTQKPKVAVIYQAKSGAIELRGDFTRETIWATQAQIAIEFRQWATKTLREYIVNGYAINRARIAKNYAQFLSAVEDVMQAFRGQELYQS